MAFAAVISFHDMSRGHTEFTISGRTMDGPFSSTAAELMALAATVAVVPKHVPVTIHTDSKAAMALATTLLDKRDLKHEYEKSNMAFLATCVRPWFQRRTAETTLLWVKGHSGIAGNEKADRAADNAHSDPMPWTTRNSQPLDGPQYRLCVGNQLAPLTPGQLTHRQGERWTENQHLCRVIRTQLKVEATVLSPSDLEKLVQSLEGPPEPALPPPPTATTMTTTTTMPTAIDPRNMASALHPGGNHRWARAQAQLIWRAANMGRDRQSNWVRKGSRKITNKADHNRRSFMIKLGSGLSATMDRQNKYYPDAYPEAEMSLCPRGCGQPETQAHLMTCAHNSTVRPPPKEEVEERLGKFSTQAALAHAFTLKPSILISEEWALSVKEATGKDKQQRRCNKGKRNLGPTTYMTNMEYQLAERLEYIYSRWKERNDYQIRREERSTTKPQRRRQIMKQLQMTERSRDGRTAAVPPILGQWGGDLLDFRPVALELRVIAGVCPIPRPP
ncbi:hypothetical protein GGH92_003715 [Coemansia sp. RSA 2673]|nr:hypothetical protein GGH92_003715 [Coemansia sp. RSA 2673]